MSGATLPTHEPTPCPETVRLAGPADEDALFHLLMLAHQENGLLALSEEKVRQVLRAMLARGSGRWGMIGIIHGPDGSAIGSVGVELETFWYSDEWYLGERWNYVHPDHRQSSHAEDLIQFSKWAADTLGVVLEMGIISTIRTEAKVRLYRRQMKQVGAFFVHGLERAHGPLAEAARAA